MSLLTKHSMRKSTLKKSKSKSVDVEYTDHDLPSLRRKRTIAYKRLSKALEIGLSATDNASDLTQRELFLSYHQEIKQIAASFEHTHFAILDISDDPEQNDDEIQDRFDEMYFKVLAIHRNLTTGELSQSVNNKHSSNIRLPKITLPSFSGNIKKWPEYIDAYNALIHNSTSLTETEKFHYLISSLSGDALLVVKTFPITHEHYQDAYQALTARFKSKRELAFTCWRDLLNMEFNSRDAHEFRKSLDAFEENLSILKTVNLPVGQWDFVLVYHILSKLDKTLRRDFEEKYYNIELPSYNQLKEYLHSKCEALVRDSHFTEPIQLKFNKPATSKVMPAPLQQTRANLSHALIVEKDAPQNSTNSKLIITQQHSSTCSFCRGPHSISSCADFLKKPHEERMQLAAEKNWCFNCLKSSHQLKNCTSIFTCRKCRRKHHTLLHRDDSSEPNNTASSLVASSLSVSTVLLPTAIVQVKDASGRMQSFRALFDTGSQSNFITETAMNRLNLIRTKANTRINGLGEAGAQITGDVTCDIGTNDKKIFTVDMHVISKICGDQPIAQLNTSGWSHIESLSLADPRFHIPGPIDILFAADVFVESLLHQTIKGTPNQPSAFKSVFGWLLLGSTRPASRTLLCSSSNADNELNLLVQRSWESDSLPAQRLIPDDRLYENKFFTDHSRDNSERYIVHIPFKDKADPIFNASRDPHHYVLRPNSLTTSLRVVFEGSVHIQGLKPIECQHHVSPSENPADIYSRGKFPSEILNISLWWAAPCWLSQERESWPTDMDSPSTDELVAVESELRKLTPLVSGLDDGDFRSKQSLFKQLLHRFSSLKRIINIVMYLKRFVSNNRIPAHAFRIRYLNNRERRDSLMQIRKHVQQRAFSEETNKINSKQTLSNPFRKVNPLLDDQGVLRAGGRISRSGLEYEYKHPAILPSDHQLTILIIDFIHRNCCYPGTHNKNTLCAVSSNPNDLSVLTPAHFLTLEPLTAVPDEDLTTINRLRRLQLLQAFHPNFWSRWKHEYFNSLIQRAKWTKDSKPLHVGSMMITKDDTHFPVRWPLGTVKTLHLGADGVVRVATVQTANQSVIQRSLVKLRPFPLED